MSEEIELVGGPLDGDQWLITEAWQTLEYPAGFGCPPVSAFKFFSGSEITVRRSIRYCRTGRRTTAGRAIYEHRP
jgi:hypothetical protein